MDLLKKIDVCSLCVEEKDLLSMKCGHIFCRTCATKICAEKKRRCTALCPTCKTKISMETIKAYCVANTLYCQISSFIAAVHKEAETDVNTYPSTSIRRKLPGRSKEASNVVQTPTARTSRRLTLAKAKDSSDVNESLKDNESSPAVSSLKKRILKIQPAAIEDSSPSRTTRGSRKRVISEEVTPTPAVGSRWSNPPKSSGRRTYLTPAQKKLFPEFTYEPVVPSTPDDDPRTPTASQKFDVLMRETRGNTGKKLFSLEQSVMNWDTSATVDTTIEQSPRPSMKLSRKSCARKTPLKLKRSVNAVESSMVKGKFSQDDELREDELNDEKLNIETMKSTCQDDVIKSLEVAEKMMMIPSDTDVNTQLNDENNECECAVNTSSAVDSSIGEERTAGIVLDACASHHTVAAKSLTPDKDTIKRLNDVSVGCENTLKNSSPINSKSSDFIKSSLGVELHKITFSVPEEEKLLPVIHHDVIIHEKLNDVYEDCKNTLKASSPINSKSSDVIKSALGVGLDQNTLSVPEEEKLNDVYEDGKNTLKASPPIESDSDVIKSSQGVECHQNTLSASEEEKLLPIMHNDGNIREKLNDVYEDGKNTLKASPPIGSDIDVTKSSQGVECYQNSLSVPEEVKLLSFMHNDGNVREKLNDVYEDGKNTFNASPPIDSDSSEVVKSSQVVQLSQLTAIGDESVIYSDTVVINKFSELPRDSEAEKMDFIPGTEDVDSIEFSSDVFTRRKSSEENAGARQTIEEDGASLVDRVPFKERFSIANTKTIVFSPTDKDDLIFSVCSDDSDLANHSPLSKICALTVGKTVVKETVSIQSRLSNEEPKRMGLTPGNLSASVWEDGAGEEGTKEICDSLDLRPKWRTLEFNVKIGIQSEDILEDTSKRIRDALSAANLTVYNLTPVDIAFSNPKIPPTQENKHDSKMVNEELDNIQNTLAGHERSEEVNEMGSVEAKCTINMVGGESEGQNEVLLDSSMTLSDNIKNNFLNEWVSTDFKCDESTHNTDIRDTISIVDKDKILSTSEKSPGKSIESSRNITGTDLVVSDNNGPALSGMEDKNEKCLPSESNIEQVDIISLDDNDDDDDKANFMKPPYDWNIIQHVRLWDDQQLLSNSLFRDETGTYRNRSDLPQEVMLPINQKHLRGNVQLSTGKSGEKTQQKTSKIKTASAVKTGKKAIDNPPITQFTSRNDGQRSIMDTVRLESCQTMQGGPTSALPNYKIANTNSKISEQHAVTVKSSALVSDGTRGLPVVNSHNPVRSEVTEVLNMEVEQVSQPSVNTLTAAQSSPGHNTSMLGDDDDEDMFIPQTPSQELVPRHHSPLLATCFSPEKKAILVEFTRRFGVPILENFDTNVQCVVMGDQPYEITPKVLFGLTMSCMFLSLEWIEESLRKGVVESAEPFLLPHEVFSTEIPCDLWADINFSLVGRPTFAVDDLKILLEICGGRFYHIDDFELINTPNKLKMILTFEPETLSKEYVAEMTRSCRAPVVDFSFITDCASHGELSVVTAFVRYSDQPEIDLARFGYPSEMVCFTDSDDSDEW